MQSYDQLITTIKQNGAGKDQAFAELETRLRLYVMKIALAWKNIADIDDLYQEALLRIYASINDFDPTKHTNGYDGFPSYLSMLLSCHFANLAKRKKRTVKTIDLFADDGEIGPCADAEGLQQLDEREVLQGYVTALEDLLSGTEYEALRLFVFEERNYEEIAAILGTNTKTVDNALQRTKQKLRPLILGGSFGETAQQNAKQIQIAQRKNKGVSFNRDNRFTASYGRKKIGIYQSASEARQAIKEYAAHLLPT